MLWIVIQKPSSWTKETLCITATGRRWDVTLLFSRLSFGVDWWDFSLRAAAHSKLGNYTEATGDCERAIAIDPSYSKAYGRMG